MQKGLDTCNGQEAINSNLLSGLFMAQWQEASNFVVLVNHLLLLFVVVFAVIVVVCFIPLKL